MPIICIWLSLEWLTSEKPPNPSIVPLIPFKPDLNSLAGRKKVNPRYRKKRSPAGRAKREACSEHRPAEHGSQHAHNSWPQTTPGTEHRSGTGRAQGVGRPSEEDRRRGAHKARSAGVEESGPVSDARTKASKRRAGSGGKPVGGQPPSEASERSLRSKLAGGKGNRDSEETHH